MSLLLSGCEASIEVNSTPGEFRYAAHNASILGIELTLDLAHSLPDLRIPTGVIVAARTLGSGTVEIPLQTGDVIHGVNGTTITTLVELREALAKQKAGDAVVLQVERYAQLIYVSFSL